MRYMVAVEQGPDSFGAYVHLLIQGAIEFHLEGLKEKGASLPQPHSTSEFVEAHVGLQINRDPLS